MGGISRPLPFALVLFVKLSIFISSPLPFATAQSILLGNFQYHAESAMGIFVDRLELVCS